MRLAIVYLRNAFGVAARAGRAGPCVFLLVMAAAARPGFAQRWQDATAQCLGTTAEWSSKLELADVDGDGLVDILVANGGNYDQVGPAEPTRVWKNLGNWSDTTAMHCQEISAQAVLGFTGHSRVIKVADVDGDGDLDIVTGGAYQSQLKLFLRDGSGWTDATANLPQQLTSVGDLEFGDVDGDGDLDIVIADWGATPPHSASYVGGQTRLYLNDGTGHFTDATANLPTALVGWSWDMELVDVDNDFDLDILVSCKACSHQFLFINDGTGHFTDNSAALPVASNNYEFEPMDIDGDGDLDLITLNDGPSSKSRLFVNQGDGTFKDETTRIAPTANPGADDNAAVWLDVDNDGDADLLIASLSGPERLLINDGTGKFTLAAGSSTPDDTPGSLGIAIADLDGDGRLDVVQSQGEVAFPEKVQLASSAVAIDTQPPVVSNIDMSVVAGGVVRARVHDHQSPSHAHDWKSVVLIGTTEAGDMTVPMTWYGEYLWRAPLPPASVSYKVCGTDRAGNMGCSADVPVLVPGDDFPVGGDGGFGDDAGMSTHKSGGGCCDAGGSPGIGALFGLGFLATRRRRVSA